VKIKVQYHAHLLFLYQRNYSLWFVSSKNSESTILSSSVRMCTAAHLLKRTKTFLFFLSPFPSILPSFQLTSTSVGLSAVLTWFESMHIFVFLELDIFWEHLIWSHLKPLILFILVCHTSQLNYRIIVNTVQCDSIGRYLLPLHVLVSWPSSEGIRSTCSETTIIKFIIHT
jgi:hypothetical protein